DQVRAAQTKLAELGKKGIAFNGEDSGQRTEYLFTQLNDIEPAMVGEATQDDRSVAEKFTDDSQSHLGKIKTANHGLFSIEDRDSNTPYLKKVRVVSTVDYYLADQFIWLCAVIDRLNTACYFARIVPDAVFLKCPSTPTLSIAHRKNRCILFMKMMIWW